VTEDLRIGIGIASGDVFWVQVNEAIYRRSQQYPVKLIPLFRSHFFSALTPDDRKALLEEIAAQELDVLVGWSFPEVLSRAVLDMGVPIVHLFETIVEHPLCVSPVGLQQIAEDLIHYLAKLLDYRGTLLVIGGLLRDDLPDDGRSRVTGIQNALKNYPEIRFQHIPTGWFDVEAEAQICGALREWKQPVDAIFGLSDALALAGRKVALEMNRAGEHTPVVGINGDPAGLAAVLEGRMKATVETPAISFGSEAVDIAIKIATGQPYPAHYTYHPRLITAENVTRVATEKLVAIADIPSYLVNFERTSQQEYQDYLETSLDISRQIGSVLDYRHLPVELARLIRTNYDYDHVQLFYWSERDGTLLLMEDEDAPTPAKRIPVLNAGVLSQALVGDEPIFIPDCQRSIRFAPDPEWTATRSRVILPVRQGGKALALLDLHAFRVMHCTRQHLMGLQSLADQIGVAIRNAQLYAEALEAQRTAEKADKLKLRLLANVSHELRNPLHIILHTLERTAAAGLTPDESGQIHKNAVHLLRLINDLVDLSRAEIDELLITPEFLEPVDLLTDVFESMAKTGTQAVTWHLELPERLPMIQADPDRLRQILLNLLSNARKFTTQGSITLGAGVTAPYFHIRVQDTGSGIPAEQQQLIFEPFASAHQTNHRKDGIGLGLSITRRLVALHGGLMTVESRPNKGSVFHVYLPLPVLDRTLPVPSAADLQPMMLVVSSRQTLLPELKTACQHQGLDPCHVLSYEDIDRVLHQGLPTAIAWDADAASEAEWQLIQQLRGDARLCSLPFLLYGKIADTSRAAGIVLKPVNSKTLLSLMNGMFNPGESGYILVVDDDADARHMYFTLVSDQFPGVACKMAANGKEAVALMTASVPRLVVLDLMMPDMDGFEVIQWMRSNRRTAGVPVVILSGKILSLENIRQLEPYQKVTFQSKQVLSDEELVSSFQRLMTDNTGLPPQTSTVVKQAVAYIHGHYELPLSRVEIAQSVGVSENYLTHIFHQELGVSLWDYLNRYRVLQAKDLLRHTHDSIAVISGQVGFDDPAYFSRVFRRYVGQSPRMYRNSPATE
jgi:signal transduction histidine kinase/AraC-like DNA-binding protein